MEDDKTVEKFMTIEKFLNELVEMRQQIAELKASEARWRTEAARLQQEEEEQKKQKEQLQGLLDERSTELATTHDRLQREISERKQVEDELAAKGEDVKRLSQELADLKRVEGALKICQQKLDFMVENVPIGLWVALDEKLIFVNAKCPEILGYAKEELSWKPLAEIIHPDDQTMVRERYSDWLSGKTPPNIYACRIVHKDGTVKWVENKIAFIQWEGESAIANFVIDITDRKWAREELRNSIDQFRTLVNSLEEILLTWDREKH